MGCLRFPTIVDLSQPPSRGVGCFLHHERASSTVAQLASKPSMKVLRSVGALYDTDFHGVGTSATATNRPASFIPSAQGPEERPHRTLPCVFPPAGTKTMARSQLSATSKLRPARTVSSWLWQKTVQAGASQTSATTSPIDKVAEKIHLAASEH